MIEIISWSLVGLGSFFMVSAALGMLRFPDFYTRLHAASLADSLGIMLVMVGLAVHAGVTVTAAKLIVLLLFMLITGPTATHAIARVALLGGLKPKGEDKA